MIQVLKFLEKYSVDCEIKSNVYKNNNDKKLYTVL